MPGCNATAHGGRTESPPWKIHPCKYLVGQMIPPGPFHHRVSALSWHSAYLQTPNRHQKRRLPVMSKHSLNWPLWMGERQENQHGNSPYRKGQGKKLKSVTVEGGAALYLLHIYTPFCRHSCWNLYHTWKREHHYNWLGPQLPNGPHPLRISDGSFHFGTRNETDFKFQETEFNKHLPSYAQSNYGWGFKV